MNTTEKNKIIADFMGQKETIAEFPQFGYMTSSGNFKTEFTANEMKFHKDWNWLMEVVEKIFSLDEYYNFKQTLGQFDTAIRDRFPNKEGVYNMCVEFIKWYNEQNK